MLEGRRMFRIVLSPAGFPNFCHNFCPALLSHSRGRLKSPEGIFEITL